MGVKCLVVAAVATACGVTPLLAQQPMSGAGVEGTEIPRDPSFLLGTWHITERIYPDTEREYVERSVRVCQPALMGRYVLCRTEATARGRQREYWFLVNEYDGEGTLEFIGVLTNVPFKTIYRGRFLDDGSGIDLVSYSIDGDAFVAGNAQTIRFISPDEFEWRIGISDRGTPDEEVIGIERAVRVSEAPPPA